MKKMQKVFALILTATIMFAALSGCAKRDPDDKGASINMYLASDPSNLNLDPAKMLYSSEAVKFIGLVFEGLTVMDEDGKIKKGAGMAKDWRIIEDEEKQIYKMQFDLKDTGWSDGTPVTADDFVYAWKRILQPDFHSPAASLLYYIKNARLVKEGEMTVDDLGVVSLDQTLLEVTFERKIDYDKFLENVASIALVPVRSDTVDYYPDDWAMASGAASISQTFLTNGPFSMKTLEYNKGAMLERSMYYLADKTKEEAPDKYVKPYRIYLDFSRSLDAITDAYNTASRDDQVFFLGNVTKARFGELENKAVMKDMLSVYSLHFNANRAPFDNEKVRKALSIALDRNKIVEIVGLGVKPATGIVPTGIVGEKSSTNFREENGELISPSGNISEANSLLQGVSSFSVELKVRNSPAEIEVAEYIISVWNQLNGVTATVKTEQGKTYSDVIMNTDYQVMAFDYQAVGLDAYSILAPFAMPFSGSAKPYNPEGGIYEDTPYSTGFQNDAYDALIEEIFMIDDNTQRHEKLKEAEKQLVELSPIAPLYFNKSINITEEISDISYSKYGFPIFTKAILKNYLDYTTTAEPRVFIE